MEVEPRIVKQYTAADAKITGERKSLCIVVWLPEDREFMAEKNAFWGIL